jgi:hypothetical protein
MTPDHGNVKFCRQDVATGGTNTVRFMAHERVETIPAASHRRDADPPQRANLPGDTGEAHDPPEPPPPAETFRPLRHDE